MFHLLPPQFNVSTTCQAIPQTSKSFGTRRLNLEILNYLRLRLQQFNVSTSCHVIPLIFWPRKLGLFLSNFIVVFK